MVMKTETAAKLELIYSKSSECLTKRWSVLFVGVGDDYLSDLCYLYSKYVLKDLEPELTHCVFYDGTYAYDPTTTGIFVTEHPDVSSLMLEYGRNHIESVTYTPRPEALELVDYRMVNFDRLKLRDFVAFGLGYRTGMLCTDWVQYVTGVKPQDYTRPDRHNFMTPSELKTFMLFGCKDPTRLVKVAGKVFKVPLLH
jgi:hypothetical protein